jgi:hypothetical protein
LAVLLFALCGELAASINSFRLGISGVKSSIEAEIFVVFVETFEAGLRLQTGGDAGSARSAVAR